MVGDNGEVKRGRKTERVHEGKLIPVYAQHENHEKFNDLLLEFSIEFMDYGQDELFEELTRLAQAKVKKGKKKKRKKNKKL